MRFICHRVTDPGYGKGDKASAYNACDKKEMLREIRDMLTR